MYRWIVLLSLFLVTASSTYSGKTDRPAEDLRLEALFKDYLETEFKLHPLFATRSGDRRFDHQLDDVSPTARKADHARAKQWLADLPRKVNAKKLSRDGQIDLEIWQDALRRDLWHMENTDPWANDPRVYNDFITESVYNLFAQSTLPKADNARNAVQRMVHIPRIALEAKRSLKHPPKVIVETAIKQNKGAIAFYETGVFELSGESPTTSDLSRAAKKVIPVLREYQKFLENDLLPRSNGEWRIGKAKFAEKLKHELGIDMSADELLKEAEAEAVRIETEMYIIARQLWAKVYPKKTLPIDDAAGRRETIRLVLRETNKDTGRPEDLIKDANAMADKIKQFITKKDMLRLPTPDQCKIIEMPEFHRGNSIAYLNPAPPLDPKASSYYAISPPPAHWDAKRVASFMEEYNRDMLQILTIHEAYPGHYVQLAYSNRHPSLIRRLLSSGTFAEGWAVYTEKVMLDEGFGDGDLKMRLNQLKWYLRAVVNAILDHRMHCGDMTDEEAMFLLVVRAFQSEAEAILKVIRAKQSSCQLSTYFAGRMAFYRLRQSVQQEMGERFELGRFHEAMLDHGTLPVKFLPEITRERLTRPR